MKKLVVAVLLLVCVVTLFGCTSPMDNMKTYIDKVDKYTAPDGSKLISNSNDDAYAQTVVHDIIMKHYDSPLAEGKTQKKAIFIGYDGCRVDVLDYAKTQKDNRSGLLKVRDMGKLVYAYAGSPNKDQATSTAPGWSSMLTGKWANEEGGHGVNDNGIYKKVEVETFLTKLAKRNKNAESTYSSSFTTSWRHHQSVTYFYDIEKATIEGTNIIYTHTLDDQATYYDVLERVNGREKNADKDTDVTFLTLEGTDHGGHDYGFGIQTPEYIEGFMQEDSYAYNIIETIEARPNYATEDWIFVISTDHGGYKTGHGGQTILERTTWLATSHPQYLPTK